MGYRMLHALGIRPDVCHLNEGHAAFAVWERARLFMEEAGQPFESALLATRAGNIFTTHTPVEAGIDRFPAYLIEPYLREYSTELHVKVDDLLALGRANPNDPNEPFNMAYLGIRGCGAVNGVSQLHAQVSLTRYGIRPVAPTAGDRILKNLRRRFALLQMKSSGRCVAPIVFT
jgi:starch phosphorylase